MDAGPRAAADAAHPRRMPRTSTRPPKRAPTRSSRRSSSPSPTATPTTATAMCRWSCCCRRSTRPRDARRSATAASREWRPGAVPGRAPFRPPLRQHAPRCRTGEPTVWAQRPTRGDTCHIDVVDRWGNMIAVTPSGGWLQSSPTIPELGFCLGTRLQMTWLDAASPAALRAGARPRTTLTPTLVLRDGRAEMALGTPGGDQQEQWQLPVLLRMIVGRLHRAAGDRRAVAAHHGTGGLVLAARVDAGGRGRRGPARRRGDRRTRAARPRRDPLGRLVARPGLGGGPRCRDRTASGPPPTRAACRATPPAADRPALRSGRGGTPRRAAPARRRPRRRAACGPSPRTSGRRPRSTRPSRPGTSRRPARAASEDR